MDRIVTLYTANAAPSAKGLTVLFVSGMYDHSTAVHRKTTSHLTLKMAAVDDTLSQLAIPDIITTRLDVSNSTTVKVDTHLMQRALSNLITNAGQKMPKVESLPSMPQQKTRCRDNHSR